jgi:hypothetical protein
MVAEPADEKRPESAAKGLRESLDQFLDLLDEHQLLPADTTDNRRAAFEAIVDSLRIPASVEARSEIEPGRKPESDDDTVRSVDTVGGVFVRIWVGDVNDTLLPALRAGLGTDVAHGHYEGVAVDLRGARGEALEAAPEAASFFKELGLPVVVLIDGNTTGAAERLAVELKDKTGAVALGEATRGVPFETFTAELPSGETVRLPRIADASRDAQHRWRQQPVRPDVEADAALPTETDAQVPGAQPVWSPNVLEGDACLRRAVDLLTTIRAMGG